jgi:hypothetical protein
MPKMIAVCTVTVVREGAQVHVKPGTLFDFTAEELKELNAGMPEAVRSPKNESALLSESPEPTSAETHVPARQAKPGPAIRKAGGSDDI